MMVVQKQDPQEEAQPVAARTRSGRARLTDAPVGPRESKASAKSRMKGKRREKPLLLSTSPPIINDFDSNVHTPISLSTQTGDCNGTSAVASARTYPSPPDDNCNDDAVERISLPREQGVSMGGVDSLEVCSHGPSIASSGGVYPSPPSSGGVYPSPPLTANDGDIGVEKASSSSHLVSDIVSASSTSPSSTSPVYSKTTQRARSRRTQRDVAEKPSFSPSSPSAAAAATPSASSSTISSPPQLYASSSSGKSETLPPKSTTTVPPSLALSGNVSRASGTAERKHIVGPPVSSSQGSNRRSKPSRWDADSKPSKRIEPSSAWPEHTVVSRSEPAVSTSVGGGLSETRTASGDDAQESVEREDPDALLKKFLAEIDGDDDDSSVEQCGTVPLDTGTSITANNHNATDPREELASLFTTMSVSPSAAADNDSVTSSADAPPPRRSTERVAFKLQPRKAAFASLSPQAAEAFDADARLALRFGAMSVGDTPPLLPMTEMAAPATRNTLSGVHEPSLATTAKQETRRTGTQESRSNEQELSSSRVREQKPSSSQSLSQPSSRPPQQTAERPSQKDPGNSGATPAAQNMTKTNISLHQPVQQTTASQAPILQTQAQSHSASRTASGPQLPSPTVLLRQQQQQKQQQHKNPASSQHRAARQGPPTSGYSGYAFQHDHSDLQQQQQQQQPQPPLPRPSVAALSRSQPNAGAQGRERPHPLPPPSLPPPSSVLLPRAQQPPLPRAPPSTYPAPVVPPPNHQHRPSYRAPPPAHTIHAGHAAHHGGIHTAHAAHHAVPPPVHGAHAGHAAVVAHAAHAAASSEPTFFLVIDTNQLLHEMPALTALRREPSITLVVPSVVLDELDRLKARRDDAGRPTAVATAAQNANRFLTPHYVDPVAGLHGGAGVIGQFADETAADVPARNDDDRVLACAVYWMRELPKINEAREQSLRARGYTGAGLCLGVPAHVCLLTADENVKAKAKLSHGLWANNATAFLQHLLHNRRERARAAGAAAVQAAMAMGR